MKAKENNSAKLHIRKGDTVVVITGDDRGKKGKVLEVMTTKSRAIVEGVNMITKHVKPSAKNPEGGIKKGEAGVHISNLKLVDQATGQPTKVGRKLDKNEKLQRYSKKTGDVIKNG